MEASITYPACHLPVLFGAARVRDLVAPIVPVHKILQDGTTFPNLELLAVLGSVNDGWDATVGVDVEEPLLFLLMLKELYLVHLHAESCQECVLLHLFCGLNLKELSWVHMGSYVVFQSQFLEGNGDLERIGGALAVKRNVVLLRGHGRRR